MHVIKKDIYLIQDSNELLQLADKYCKKITASAEAMDHYFSISSTNSEFTWANCIYEKTLRLSQVINLCKRRGISLDERTYQILEEGKSRKLQIINQLPQWRYPTPSCLRIDSHGFLALTSSSTSQTQLPDHDVEWHVNLALLKNLEERAEEPVKKKIRWIIYQYLLKNSTPRIPNNERLNSKDDFRQSISRCSQLGLFQSFDYYRSNLNECLKNFLTHQHESIFLQNLQYPPYFVVSDQFLELLSDRFKVIQIFPFLDEEEWINYLNSYCEYFGVGCNKSNNSRVNYFPFVIMDISAQVNELNEPEKYDALANRSCQDFIRLFKDERFKYRLNFPTSEHTMLFKIVFICKYNIGSLHAIHLIPLFAKTNINNTPILSDLMIKRTHEIFSSFIIEGGLGINNISLIEAISTQGTVSDCISYVNGNGKGEKKEEVCYLPDNDHFPIQNPMVENKLAFINTNLFKRLYNLVVHGLYPVIYEEFDETDQEKFNKTDQEKFNFQENDPYLLLGRPLLFMIKGFFHSIPDEAWNRFTSHEQHSTRELIATLLFRLQTHLGMAEKHAAARHFSNYSLSLSLAHAELLSLLILFTPLFDEQTIHDSHVANLQHIPENLRPFLTPGITKGGMNTFSGIVHAAFKNQSSRKGIILPNCYFEIEEVFSKDPTIIWRREPGEDVRLIVGQFTPSLLPVTYYFQNHLSDIINQQLSLSPPGHFFTIAIDTTNDYILDSQVTEMLIQFAEHIFSGTLNFIFFRSGHKFDVFGEDHFSVGLFYMVNNGDPKWDIFNELSISPNFKAESLATDWMTLAHQYAKGESDSYRRQIFNNTRTILSHIRPDIVTTPATVAGKLINVIGSDLKINRPFIELDFKRGIGVVGDKFKDEFYRLFFEAEAKIIPRSGFGFNHASHNYVQNLGTMRVNPGVNPEENQLIVQAIENLARILK